jgi:hypothetical protein
MIASLGHPAAYGALSFFCSFHTGNLRSTEDAIYPPPGLTDVDQWTPTVAPDKLT